MSTITANTIVQLTLGTAVVAIITAIAFYVLSKIRARSLQKELSMEDLLIKFREMKSEGVLDDEEFRIIKRQLSEKVVSKARPTLSGSVFREVDPQSAALSSEQAADALETAKNCHLK